MKPTQAQTINFINDKHRTRFYEAIKPHVYLQNNQQFCDQEYGAALLLLTSPLLWQFAEAYIQDHRIDFDGLLQAGYLSSSEALMIKLAGNLFNGQLSVDPVEFGIFDPDNFELAITAIQLRYKPFRID